MTSVLQDWVMDLPLREQGTLLTGVRGCDTALKPAHHTTPQPERGLVAFLRWCTMNPADHREIDVPGAFFQTHPPERWKASQFGHFPQHWYSHLMHCFEVVGYRHPNIEISEMCLDVYLKLVRNMHLEPESRDAMIERLSEDRIATNTVVS